MQVATLGGGCFWCLEAVYKRVEGVLDVMSGYAGGTKANPTYEEVSSGSTGHAEVVQVTFDPSMISYEGILGWFWRMHDPTTLNRQGADVGTQYRSIILYHDGEQRKIAEASRKKIQKDWNDPIVTEIVPFDRFWKAEPYHQNYFDNNRTQGYCRVVIAPKLKKLELEF
jgi:peptide-methionine (S)-S-oxide reductase